MDLWYEVNIAKRPQPPPALVLHNIWQIRATPSYYVPTSAEYAGLTILLHSVAGEGCITFPDGKAIRLPKNRMVVFPWSDFSNYVCSGAEWHFWACIFLENTPAPLRHKHAYPIPFTAERARAYRAIFATLERPVKCAEAHASSQFASLLTAFAMHEAQSAMQQPPHHECIARVLDEMHARRTHPWPVREMAQLAHLSERRFRQLFREVTGTSPKIYYDRLRLEMAREVLAMGGVRIEQLAQQLGYSCAFHFSRAFLKHFGIRPSAVRRRPADDTMR